METAIDVAKMEILMMKNLGNSGCYIMRVSRFVQIMYCCYTSVLGPWENVFYTGCYVSLQGIIWSCCVCFVMSQYGKKLVNVLLFWKAYTWIGM